MPAHVREGANLTPSARKVLAKLGPPWPPATWDELFVRARPMSSTGLTCAVGDLIHADLVEVEDGGYLAITEAGKAVLNG